MRKTNVSALLSLVDTGILDKAAALSAVDYKAKKLKGDIVFKLLLMSLLDSNKMSLRIMEQLYNNDKFKVFAGLEPSSSIRFNSLSERLCSIEVSYFEAIFSQTLDACKQRTGNKSDDPYLIRQFDSTTISASAKLLKTGMTSGLKNKQNEHSEKQVKFTVGLFQNIPHSSLMFTEQKHLAEDETLKQAILGTAFANNEIAVFDRGLKKRKTFQEFNEKDILFVTRINPTKAIKVLQQNPLPQDTETATLIITSDEQVYLYNGNQTILRVPFRLIKAISKTSKETMFFLTNIEDLPADVITDIYKQRWDIEVFFKFIKQHLHFKHFFSYSENGIKVMMYMSMITAVLLLLYKQENKIPGYKAAKFSFVEELEWEIIKEIVIICGGDPAKSPLFNKT